MARRVYLSNLIKYEAIAYAYGQCDSNEIDALNIYQASRVAMFRAISNLDVVPQHILVDARRIPHTNLPQTNMIRGDSRSQSIAAASILAKTARDKIMEDFEQTYPGYGFAKHKGYGTGQHLEALRILGPTSIHRESFTPVATARALH